MYITGHDMDSENEIEILWREKEIILSWDNVRSGKLHKGGVMSWVVLEGRTGSKHAEHRRKQRRERPCLLTVHIQKT